MGVYIYGFQNSPKYMELNGVTIPVYPWRFLYKSSSTISKNAVRNAEKAEKQFDAIKPKYGACVFKSDWHGAIIYEQPQAGTYSDNSSFPSKLVIGFACQTGRRTSIQQSIVLTEPVMVRDCVAHQRKTVMTNLPTGITQVSSYIAGGKEYSADDFEEFLADVRSGKKLAPGTPYDAFNL